MYERLDLISILNVEPNGYSLDAKDLLQAYANFSVGPLTREQLIRAVPNYDALIVRLAHQIDKEILNSSSRLKVIATATTGLNHIDLHCAYANNITVLSLTDEPGFLEGVYATSELTWALILAVTRNLPQASRSVHNGYWDRDSYKGVELNGSTLGIIGLGRIGRKVADYARAFGMKVFAYTKTSNYLNSSGITITRELTTLLKNSDIVSVHLPLNPDTETFFGKNEFSAMKKGAFFVNTSRGEIVDEEALIDALKSNRLAGAAIDVITGEANLINGNRSEIIDFSRSDSRLLITPHIGGATFQSMEKTELFMANKLLRFIQSLKSTDYVKS